VGFQERLGLHGVHRMKFGNMHWEALGDCCMGSHTCFCLWYEYVGTGWGQLIESEYPSRCLTFLLSLLGQADTAALVVKTTVGMGGKCA